MHFDFNYERDTFKNLHYFFSNKNFFEKIKILFQKLLTEFFNVL